MLVKEDSNAMLFGGYQLKLNNHLFICIIITIIIIMLLLLREHVLLSFWFSEDLKLIFEVRIQI